MGEVKHSGRVMADLLASYGVTAVFGIPGGQTLPLYYGIIDNAPKIKHILMRDETNASYAADAYARVSGHIGVCEGTSGCGGIKFVSGLAEAFNSSIPVLAIASEMDYEYIVARYRGCGSQLADMRAILTPVTKWTSRLPSTSTVAELTQTAVRMAMNGRPGPVFIECPFDLFKSEYTGPDYQADENLISYPTFRSTPEIASIDSAIELLRSAKHPVILAGGGIWLSSARDELKRFAHKMCIPIATSLSGKGAIDENDDLSLGVFGTLGANPHSEKIVFGADVVFAIGYKFSSNASMGWKIPTAGQRVIHLDIDGIELGKRNRVDVAMIGDAKATLALMLERVSSEKDKPVPDEIRSSKKEWLDTRSTHAQHQTPITPQHVVLTLNKVCSSDTILACDASFACGWAGTYFDVYDRRRTIMPRGMSGLGYGLPSAVGAAAARPDSPVVALAGDGGFNYSIGELQTIREQNMNVKVVILNNKTLGWIKWYEAVHWDGRFTECDTLRNDYAGAARSFGIDAMTITDPDKLESELKEFLSRPGPGLVDIITTETEAPKFMNDEKAVKLVNEDHARKP